MISSFAINALVEELKFLEDSTCDKIDQLDKEMFKLVFVENRNKHDILVQIGKRINETKFKLETPHKKSILSQMLRKKLMKKKLKKIKQHNFDRVIVFEFEDYFLIFEFFSNGNMLLTDKDFKIIHTFRAEEWKDRELKTGEIYKFPPSKDFKEFTLSEFKSLFTKSDIVRSLAINLHIGGEYAEKICAMAGVEKNKNKQSEKDVKELYDAFRKILKNSNYIFEVEFKKDYDSVSEAIDDKFGINTKKKNKKLSLLEKRLNKQIQAIENFENDAEKYQKIGNSIYLNFQKINQAIKQWNKDKSKLKVAHEKGKNIEIELD